MDSRKSAALISAIGVIIGAILGGLVGRSTTRVEVPPEISQTQNLSVDLAGDTIEKLYERALSAESRVEELERELEVARSAGSRQPDRTSNPSSEGNPPPPPADQLVQKGGGLAIRLLGCGLAGDTTNCDFTLECQEEDRFECLRSARLIESNGRELKPNRLGLGTQETKGSQICLNLVRGVPLRGSVRFAGLTSSIGDGSVRFLELKTDTLSAQYRNVAFR